MKLPEYSRVRFRNSPLRLVLGQIRFPLILDFAQGSRVVSFGQMIQDQFPRVSREAQVQLQAGATGFQPVNAPPLLRFTTSDRAWSIVLGEDALTLEAHAYSSIEDFLRHIRHPLEAARQALGVQERTRLGLRYTNEMRHPGASELVDWRDLLHPEFLGFAATDLFDGQAIRTLHDLQIQQHDGILAIRHGFLLGSVVQPPPPDTPRQERFYLLDLDYYDSREQPLDIDGCLQQMHAFKDVMYRFFRWTLSDALFRYLEPINA